MSKSLYSFVSALAASALLFGCAKTEEPKTLIMVTESGFPPYEYLVGGEIMGVDVDICRTVATRLGKELVVQDAKFDAVIPSVVSRKADFGAAGITVTEDRKQSVDFSIPYITSGIVIISRKGTEYATADAIKGKRIGVQSGTTSDNFCIETIGQEPERYDTPAMAAAALSAGKLDAIIVDIDPAKTIIKTSNDLVISSEFLTKEEFAVAIRKGRPEFLAVVNETIQELIAEGKIDAWKAEHEARAASTKDGDDAEAEPAAE